MGVVYPVVSGTCTQYVRTPVMMQQVAAQQKKVGNFTALFAVGGPLVRSFLQKVQCSERSWENSMESPICFPTW